MKDLYSFHAENEDLINYYNKVKEAYSRIFKRCGLNAIPVNADSGTIGGDYSHEFMVESEVGEDTILLCVKCNYGANIEKIGNTKKCPECGGELKSKKAIEIGHIFRLGTKYSKVMKATYTNEKEEEKLILMGCYGIGLSRVMASIVESNNDKNGIVWPEEVSPFQVHLIGLLSSERVEKEAEKIYQDLKKEGISVLYDNRKDKSAGEKFMDSDLIGIANRVVVSEKNLQEKGIGFKKRDENKEKIISFNELIEILKK
jgi:prolyl-tRNA synthetase